MNVFRESFKFRSEYALWCGIERERFITDGNGTFLPWSKKILDYLKRNDNRFGFELSACQIEDRIGPCRISQVREELEINESFIIAAENAVGFKAVHIEKAPDTMPLDVYPDPRYLEIQKKKPQEELLAACQVTGTHVHIGMPSAGAALRVYNSVIKHLEDLCQAGDSSNGHRLAAYKVMAPNWKPVSYANWIEFEAYAQDCGFAENPRDCWHLIRISKNGTIEFRVFGVTSDLDRVVGWAQYCHHLCEASL